MELAHQVLDAVDMDGGIHGVVGVGISMATGALHTFFDMLHVSAGMWRQTVTCATPCLRSVHSRPECLSIGAATQGRSVAIDIRTDRRSPIPVGK